MADNIQATPRNYFGGLLSDAYKYMQSPERTQQMQGFAGLLGTTGIPQTIERMAYGEPLTNMSRANMPLLKPETADALMTVSGFAPQIKAVSKMIPKNVPVGMSIKNVGSFKYPQEEALKLAQQRAALPVEQGGLGLLSSNTPAERAKAMGFDTPVYHATEADFASIRPSATGKMGKGVYTSFDPTYAERYAGGDAARTMPLVTRGEMATPELKSDVSEVVRQQMIQDNPDFNMREWKRRSNQALADQGYSGLDVDKERLMFNPEDLRSRFAAFDPFRKTAATAAAMGVAAPDLLAQEQPIITQQQIDDEMMKYGLLGR